MLIIKQNENNDLKKSVFSTHFDHFELCLKNRYYYKKDKLHWLRNYQIIVCLLMCFLLPSHAIANNTPVAFYKSFEGNIAVTTIGNSELTETNGFGDCGNSRHADLRAFC